MAEDKKYPGGISEQEYIWRNTIAFFTQAQGQLSQIDWEAFKMECEIQIKKAYQGDDVATMRKRADAIKAFKKKAGVFRKAYNSLQIISEDFTKEHGDPKGSTDNPGLKIHTNGQKEDHRNEEGSDEEGSTDPNP